VDLRLQVQNLVTGSDIDHIVVTGPAGSGFAWSTQNGGTLPMPPGSSMAEYFRSSERTSADLFINPLVRSAVPPSGGSLPLGGSTGNLIPLQNSAQLQISVYYQNNSTPSVGYVTVNNLISATDPMPTISTPDNVSNALGVTVYGQDGTQPNGWETGWVHLQVSMPSGLFSIINSNFTNVNWSISDAAGICWDNSTANIAHYQLDPYLRLASQTVDLYFPPIRNESTMFIQVHVPGYQTVYATQFMGASWDIEARLPEISTNRSYPTTGDTLVAVLANSSIGTITLSAANSPYIIKSPIEITHSLHIIGNGATVLFQQGPNDPAWPAAAPGVIYTDPGSSSSGGRVALDQEKAISCPVCWTTLDR
jgi:hypothetical protein